MDDKRTYAPICTSCRLLMRMTRSDPAVGVVAELRTYECGQCGVAAIEAVRFLQRISRALLGIAGHRYLGEAVVGDVAAGLKNRSNET